MKATATGLIGLVAMLAISPALAREGSIPHDTIACKDKSVILGLGPMMAKTTFVEFRNYISGLRASGECEIVTAGRPVTFSERRDGGVCLALGDGTNCYWTTTQPTTALAIAPRAEPETTGSAAR